MKLVPYLPNYGGYVRYGVGIIITIISGRSAIKVMNNDLERKCTEETLSSNERQQYMGYDEAYVIINKGICPTCERSLDCHNTDLDFCPHCGMHLFEYCPNCRTRKSTFNHYYFKCGLASCKTNGINKTDKPKVSPMINSNKS